MSFAPHDKPVNLTLLAEHLPALREHGPDRCSSVLSLPQMAVDLCESEKAGGLPEIIGTQDEVYVVIAGYGYLRGADDAITEVTEGDVLFVPRGHPSRFERLSKVFRTWRIRFGSRNFSER